METGPIKSNSFPPQLRQQRFGKWTVKAMSRDSFGKLRKDLDEHFTDGALARSYFDSLLVGDDVEHAEVLMIASYALDRWDDEILGEVFRLSGETLRSARERARKEKEAS